MKNSRSIYFSLLFALIGAFSLLAASSPEILQQATTVTKDTLQQTNQGMKYPVAKTVPETYEDLGQTSAADLKDPDNIKNVVEYDSETGNYIIRTMLGDQEITTPISMNAEEYIRFQQQQSSAAYWREKNKVDFTKKKDAFSLTDMSFDIGMGDKIFGEGGVKLTTQGSVETKFSIKNNKVDNPSLSENARNKTYFDFDNNIQMSVNGKVGDKIDVKMNYDTEAVFDYDAKAIKLNYKGKEDEIIKSLEGGNVSMPVNSSLISGGSSLFGVKTELQFGKLSLAAVLSQQQSQTRSVSLSGGIQKTEFTVDVAAYDENRHYFLSQFFRGNFDQWMSKLPYISSGITITKVEVWVTNKSGMLNDARNIVAFADMGETSKYLFNDYWVNDNGELPANASNKLYSELILRFAAARNFSEANATLEDLSSTEGINVGKDFERLESAQRLEPSDYTLNSNLGYISLKRSLNSDEILAVAYEYTKNGQTYQVGEFSTDGIESPKTLFLKMLKGTDYSPSSPTWELMMKNIYSIGAYRMESEDFEMNVSYKNDSVGTYMNYLNEGKIKNIPLLRVMGLDRLNNRKEAYSDGIFDYVEGYTVQSSNGRIIFPVLEPFGEHLREAIADSLIANQFVFEELYDSTLTIAQQMTEKNKFSINGAYKASSGATISLGATNVAKESVVVTAGGQTLTENSDYTVDYGMGTVTILNEALINSGTAISATCEDQSTFSMMRKSMAGLSMDYKFSDNFNLGGTLMHLSETPMTTKVEMGLESVSNTLWGLNTSFKTESQLLTNLIDKIPFLNATKPSQFQMNAEVAQLIAGSSKTMKDMSYVDDFEDSKKTINLKDITQWFLASTPFDPTGGLFPEAKLSDNLEYGKNRSLLSWYTIDGIFTQNTSSQTPSHIRNDLEQLSNHYVRLVKEKEIFPDRDMAYNQTGQISVMNLAYYPKERGPYNYNLTELNPDGTLNNTESKWGGIMRKIESGYTNFEANNVEYIEFWMMDPFVYDSLGVAQGGDLYFNLGEISEDVLKDGKRSFENGLATNANDSNLIATTNWGKVSGKTSTAYAFDNTDGVRAIQDVGLDGLTTDEEKNWRAEYVQNVRAKVDITTQEAMENDPFSPINDPAGDNYHYFRGTDYDNQRMSILQRYKHFNGMDGNSQSTGTSGESYSTAATTLPNVEDINLDFTLSESERYYQYQVSIRPNDMVVGQNYINDKRTTSVTLKNGKVEPVSWYQFKVPIASGKKVGTISGFNSIRFIRMFLTGFQDSTILRMASLDLVRGDWRNYTKDLKAVGTVASTEATVDVSTVSLEENSGRTPIRYTMPPGVLQETDPSQPGVFFQDEQSLSVKIGNLSPGDARGVYKNQTFDFRQYKKLQMYVHAEALEEEIDKPRNYEMSVFMRLGTDNQHNYYEYEIPLEISEPYNNVATSIWPNNNFMDIPFELLTAVKTNRNTNGSSYTREYFEYDPNNKQNKVKIVGNPSLAEVKTIMIGIRNNATTTKSVEVWVNELRLSGFREEGGWAALGSTVLGLSDLGTITASGRYESAGFGALGQSVSQRRMSDYNQYNMSFNFNFGRFLPEKAKVSIPLYYSISSEKTTPKYDPLNEDLLMDEELKATKTKAGRDSILNYSQTSKNYRSLNLTNVRVDLKSKTPLPIDPANFSFNYSSTEALAHDPTTDHEITQNYNGGISYSYASPLKPWQPFAKDKKMTSPWMKSLKELNLGVLPNSITANTNLMRYYYELQSRDLTAGSANSGELFPLTVSKNFLWNTDMAVNWNITKDLKLNFSMNNRAEVEETLYSPVNKELFATEYENWKDTVTRSLREFGTPLDYTQTANLTWLVPLSRIPVLDFLTLNTQYNAVYSWARTAVSSTETNLGNQITNSRLLSLTASAKLITIYNKSDFLKGVLKKMNETKKPVQPSPKKKVPANGKANTPESPEKPDEKPVKEAKKYEKEVTLMPDSILIVKHDLKNKRIYVMAIDSLGKNIPLKYKVKDENNVVIFAAVNEAVKLTVVQKPPLENEGWYKTAEIAARTLMSLRDVSMTFNKNDGMILPGFQPESGLFGNSSYGSAPGWDFALGFQPDNYLDKAMEKNWLINNDSVVSPAIVTDVTDLKLKATLEPLPGFKIDLNAARAWNYNSQIQYMFTGMPKTKTGTFTMTTIALSTAFDSPKASNGYASKAFQKFLDNRAIVAGRLEKKMAGVNYPDAGFLVGTKFKNTPYDPFNGTFDKNSADVLIPAFLAAYTGKDIQSSNLNIFPALSALLPNYGFTYDGLSNLDFIRKYFRNVTLNHKYTCTYSAAQFTSYNTFVDAGNGLGFVRDVLSDHPIPSSMYDVSSVTLMEAFNPLFGVRGTLLNGWTVKTEWIKSRTMNLSIAGGQVIEADNDKYEITTDYKISNFHPWGFLEKSKVKNDLSLSGSLSYKSMHTLLRKIEQNYTQASSGNKTFGIKLQGDYVISKNMNMMIFYDRNASVPLVSSYPVTSSDFGFSLRFTLNR